MYKILMIMKQSSSTKIYKKYEEPKGTIWETDNVEILQNKIKELLNTNPLLVLEPIKSYKIEATVEIKDIPPVPPITNFDLDYDEFIYTKMSDELGKFSINFTNLGDVYSFNNEIVIDIVNKESQQSIAIISRTNNENKYIIDVNSNEIIMGEVYSIFIREGLVRKADLISNLLDINITI